MLGTMRPKLPRTKWCHVTLTTYKRRKVFKIAATARFCERLLRETCDEHGWQADVISVRPDAVHVLLQVPRTLSRDAVVRRLRSAASRAVQTGPICPNGRRVFETGNWFAVLPGGARVAAVRRNLIRCGGAPAVAIEWDVPGRLDG
jgi:REP element-mobilizing transposase RayT